MPNAGFTEAVQLLNLGILISGRGSNMKAILESVRGGKIPINPAVVISSSADAGGLETARKLGVDALVLDAKKYGQDRAQYDGMIAGELARRGVTPDNGLVCLAGFMRILGKAFVRRYRGRILNIHPALLPSFPGLHAQRQAVEYGVKYSGCTVHFVDEGVDTGPILLQEVVPVHGSDTPESLAARILEKEHIAYPEAVRLFAEGKADAVMQKAARKPI